MKLRKEIVVVLMLSMLFGNFIFVPFKNNENKNETLEQLEETESQSIEFIEPFEESIEVEIPSLEIVMEAETIETASEIETTEEETVCETSIEETEETTIIEAVFTPIECMMEPDLQEWVFNYCEDTGLDPYIIIAICERESGCTANIMGDNGKAYGMMQIQVRWVQDKLAAHGYTNETMLYAQPNIVIGIEILRDYINMGNGIEWALMAYNGGIPLVGTDMTREYAAWVLARANELRSENC